MKIIKYWALLICAVASCHIAGTEAWYFDLHLNGPDSWFLKANRGQIMCEESHKWALRFDFYYDFANKGFNDSGVHTSLASTIFNNCITLRDVSLFIKLSDGNMVHRCPVESSENPLDRCQRPQVEPNTIVRRFGRYRSDLYTTLLAPTSLCFDAEQHETEAGLTYLYRFGSEDCNRNYQGYLGFRLPIQSRLHVLDLQLLGGSLFAGIVGTGGALLENTLTEFYKDYISMEDFFARGILEPKDLCYKARRRKTGFGDFSAFGIISYTPCQEFIDLLQVGLNLVLPTGGKLKSDYIWEPYLGNGGACQIDFFANILFHTKSPYWNPLFRASAQVSRPFTACLRVPQCKINQNQAQVNTIDDLLVVGPSTYDNFWVMPYEQLDTTVPWFADEAVPTRITWGTKWIVGMGNFFYDDRIPHFRFGMFYDYIGKKEDTYEPRCCTKKFAPQVLTYYTREDKHRISWDFAYLHEDWIEVSIGSKHVVAGRNVAQTHELYAALFITF